MRMVAELTILAEASLLDEPLYIFDHSVWTKMDPVCFWYNDCVWGHPSRPVPLAMAEHHDMCKRKEELEYSMPEEVANNDIYKAPPVNRFRTNYKVLHMMQSTWTLEQKIRSVTPLPIVQATGARYHLLRSLRRR